MFSKKINKEVTAYCNWACRLTNHHNYEYLLWLEGNQDNDQGDMTQNSTCVKIM